MASEIVDGDPEFPRSVEIRTPNFAGTALPLHTMPGVQVMLALGSDDVQDKMWRMFQLFLVSLNGGQEVIESLGLIDYNELLVAIGQWITESNIQAASSLMHNEVEN
jgi:hypothetical protein